MYEPRTYRHWIKDRDLVSFNVVVKETDLFIRASTNLKRKALKLVLKYRGMLEKYIERHPSFLTSLEPVTIGNDAPRIVSEMAESARKVGIGPMASVAGAIAEFVGSQLLAFSPEIIVENGGDIYLGSFEKRLIGIYAGKSPLTGKIGLEVNGQDTPLGICTSSGTVGHSLSYGKADAVIVLSKSAALADAAATAIGNLIIQPSDIPSGIEFAQGIDGLKGVIIIKDDKVGLWGEVKICQMSV
ncbi:MAG: UPF0280 family protein [Dehalococcoidia bacterium]|nr:UPF0280 family protein [Dehalococcoidia bacterium]